MAEQRRKVRAFLISRNLPTLTFYGLVSNTPDDSVAYDSARQCEIFYGLKETFHISLPIPKKKKIGHGEKRGAKSYGSRSGYYDTLGFPERFWPNIALVITLRIQLSPRPLSLSGKTIHWEKRPFSEKGMMTAVYHSIVRTSNLICHKLSLSPVGSHGAHYTKRLLTYAPKCSLTAPEPRPAFYPGPRPGARARARAKVEERK